MLVEFQPDPQLEQEQEKENPLNGGPCSPHDADA